MQKLGEYKFQIILGLLVFAFAGYGIYGMNHLPEAHSTSTQISTATSKDPGLPTLAVKAQPSVTKTVALRTDATSPHVVGGMLQNAPAESPENLAAIAQMMDQSGLFRISKLVEGSTGGKSESALLNMLSSGTLLRDVACPAPTMEKEKYTCTLLGVYVLNDRSGGTLAPTHLPASASKIWLILSIAGSGGVRAPVSIDYARSPEPLRKATMKSFALDEAGLQHVQRGRPLTMFIPVKGNRWQYACNTAAPLEECQPLINFGIWFSSGITAEIYLAAGGFPQNAVAFPALLQIPAPKTGYEFPIASFAIPGGQS